MEVLNVRVQYLDNKEGESEGMREQNTEHTDFQGIWTLD